MIYEGMRSAVLRIRDAYPGSEFFPPRIRIKQFQYFDPKQWFLSSRKYDPGCLSRIRISDPDFYPSRIPDPGVKKAPDPGSATLKVSRLLIWTEEKRKNWMSLGLFNTPTKREGAILRQFPKKAREKATMTIKGIRLRKDL